jgi:hypothetical protein
MPITFWISTQSFFCTYTDKEFWKGEVWKVDHAYPKTLAWHKTLEMHELVAFQSIGLMKLKIGLNNIQDSNL